MKNLLELDKGSTFSWLDYKGKLSYNQFYEKLKTLRKEGRIKELRKIKTKKVGRPPILYKIIASIEVKKNKDPMLNELEKIKSDIAEIKALLKKKKR